MTNEFALELKVARRKAGLTQRDCAHLLGIDHSTISNMEHGKAVPSLRDMLGLSLIYGKSFESLFRDLMHEVAEALKERLTTLPEAPNHWLGRHNRVNTLNKLARYLQELEAPDHGAA